MKTERNNSTNNGNGQDLVKMVEDRRKKAEPLVSLVEFDPEKRIYRVGSSLGKATYTVSKPNGEIVCTCDDFSKIQPLGIDCKHIMAVRFWWEKQKANGNGKSNEAHNHPSGVTDPSREDIDITRRLKEVGELMGIKLPGPPYHWQWRLSEYD